MEPGNRSDLWICCFYLIDIRSQTDIKFLQVLSLLKLLKTGEQTKFSYLVAKN